VIEQCFNNMSKFS